MSINIITSFNSSSREVLDKRSGAYSSIGEALSALGTNSRAMGMPIYVIENGTQDDAGNFITGAVKTFSFTGGIADENFTERTVAIKVTDLGGFVPTSRDQSNFLTTGIGTLDVTSTSTTDGIPVYGASGESSIAVGLDNKATGFGSVVFGSLCESTGYTAMSLGYQSKATGTFSIAMGYQVESTGYSAVALGTQNTVSGNYGFAAGRNHTVSHFYGAAIGDALISKSVSAVVVGQANTDYTILNPGGNNQSDQPMFIVGNGSTTSDSNNTAVTRSDALVAYYSGAVVAPSLTTALIDSTGDTSLITKEYFDSNGVPYVGATQDLDLGANGIIAQSVQVSGGTGTEGTLTWNAQEATMDLQSGGVTYQIGQEIAPLVRNSTGVTITNGTPVRFSGTLGNSGRILIAPAIADGTIPSSYILGVATEDIINGADGHITWFGKVRGIDTSGTPYGQVWADGDIIYVSATTAGWLTNVKPQAPSLQIFIGVVVSAHGNNGTLFTRPSWRSSLEDLDDVNGTPATVSGQILVWDNNLKVFDFTDNINEYAKLTNQIIVTQSNVATTLGGTIDSTKEYFLDGIIDLGTTQITVPVNGIELKGYSFNGSGLVSTEDNYTMFISESIVIGSGDILGVDFYIETSGTNSKVYEVYDSTGFHAIEMNRVNYMNCTSLGDMHNYRQGLELGTGRFGGSPSLTLHGIWVGGFRISTSIIRDMSDTTTAPLFCAGTAFVMNSRFLTDLNIDLGTLQPFTDFSPANFPNPSSLKFVDVLLTRDGVINAEDSNITPNVSESDTCSAWSGNHGIHNTFVGGAQKITVEVQTAITAINVATPILGTFVASDLQHFDSPANGQLRFLGTSPIEYSVSWDFILDGAPNAEYRIELVRERSGITTVIYGQTRVINNLQGGRDVAYFTGSHHERILQNDITYWQVKNLSGTINCTLEFDSNWTLDHR